MTLVNKTEYSYLEDIKLSKELVSKFIKEIITILKILNYIFCSINKIQLGLNLFNCWT